MATRRVVDNARQAFLAGKFLPPGAVTDVWLPYIVGLDGVREPIAIAHQDGTA
jgi:hypothetical protein